MLFTVKEIVKLGQKLEYKTLDKDLTLEKCKEKYGHKDVFIQPCAHTVYVGHVGFYPQMTSILNMSGDFLYTGDVSEIDLWEYLMKTLEEAGFAFMGTFKYRQEEV